MAFSTIPFSWMACFLSTVDRWNENVSSHTQTKQISGFNSSHKKEPKKKLKESDKRVNFFNDLMKFLFNGMWIKITNKYTYVILI